MKEKLKEIIKKSLDDNISLEEITIETPKEKTNGDFSTNIAMKMAKKLNKSPIELANIIKEKINEEYIEKIVVAGPGFINFYLKKDYLLENIKKVINEKENYGRSDYGKNIKIDPKNSLLFEDDDFRTAKISDDKIMISDINMEKWDIATAKTESDKSTQIIPNRIFLYDVETTELWYYQAHWRK